MYLEDEAHTARPKAIVIHLAFNQYKFCFICHLLDLVTEEQTCSSNTTDTVSNNNDHTTASHQPTSDPTPMKAIKINKKKLTHNIALFQNIYE